MDYTTILTQHALTYSVPTSECGRLEHAVHLHDVAVHVCVLEEGIGKQLVVLVNRFLKSPYYGFY